MPNTRIERLEKWAKQEDGSEILVEVIENEVEMPTQEEVIAEKEAKLLEMYQELEALKSANNAE